MFQKPNFDIIFQKEQVNNFGCCLSRDETSKLSYFLKIPSRKRVYSEARQSKTKKLDLTITKKSSSQTKQTHNSANTSLQRRKNIVTSRSKQSQFAKQKQPTVKYLKTMNQIYTSKDPTTYINHLLRYPIYLGNNHQNQSKRNVNFQIGPQQKIKKIKQTLHIPDISSITKVEQQFVSQGSATLTILNTISNTQRNQKPQMNQYTFNTARQLNNASNSIHPQSHLPSQKIISTPFERMDRKRYEQKIQKTKKKMMN